jgi:hypothetical protein
MKIEISALFGMQTSEGEVTQVHIGDGVNLQKYDVRELFSTIKDSDTDSYRRLLFRQSLEWHSYTHRFFISVDAARSTHSKEISDANQLIMRAIVLSRIIRPLPIPLHPTKIYTVYRDSGDINYEAQINVGFYSTAYLVNKNLRETFSQNEAKLMAKHWPASQYLYANRKHFKRLYRALYTFNDAYHILPKHLSHVVLHAALESLICVDSRDNYRQVTKRLPQLVTGLTEQEAIDIYKFCCDVKHEAAPGALYSADVTKLDARDARRQAAARNLEQSVRTLLLRSLEDLTFAETLEDKASLRQKYPV